MTKKIILFGLGEKAYRILQAHFTAKRRCYLLVIVGRDLNVSNDYADHIIQLCKEHQIPYTERKNFNGQDIKYDYAIAVGWRWMIAAPKEKLIVIHDSLLPKHRGFSPLVNCLINGERTIGATALFASDEYDKGPIITQETIEISYPIKIQDAISMVSELYIKIFNYIIGKIEGDLEITGAQQDNALATYSLWRDENDYFINWEKSAEEICRFIDAVGTPYEGAKSNLNKQLIRIVSATTFPDVQIIDRSAHIGKVIFIENGKPIVVCKNGLLKINEATTLLGHSVIPMEKFRSRFN